MTGTRHLAVVAVAVATIALNSASCRRVPAAGTGDREPIVHTVTIEGTEFRPSVVTVRVGDRIVWVNKDFFPHTATAPNGLFDSGALATDESWMFTPTTLGVLDYTCTYHPTMKGTVRVE